VSVSISTTFGSGLASDRRVDLRKQCRRNLDEGDTAHVAGRRETRNVSDYSTAKCDDGRVAICSHCGQLVQYDDK
jgi:hypothetical protein